MADMEIGTVATSIIRAVDFVFMHAMQLASNVLPNYQEYNTVAWVAYGYNIEVALLSMIVLKALVYFLVVSPAGYFFLKTREVAA
jgi:hypothetical protein